jgi:phage FluMu protein Com
METVQLQCGHCQKVMAIGVEHLGSQLQCPHCLSVVQTQAPAPQPTPAPVPETASHPDSIFADHEPTDAVIGGEPSPKVEMPTASMTTADLPPPSPVADLTANDATDFTKFKPKPIYDSGVLMISAMIFLVPYALLTTGIIIYLLFFSSVRGDPLEYLPDPVPEKTKGGPKRVSAALQPKHDQPLAPHLRTTLGKPIQVGDLQVTFAHVRINGDGNMELVARAKNMSANTNFEPTNEFFVKFDSNKPDSKPYSFLESRSKRVDTIYGAYLGYHKNPNGADEPAGSAPLGPGEETTIVLTTYDRYQKAHIPAIAKSKDDYTWRLHVRRGFVKKNGNDVPATAVVGVDFASADIEMKR